MKKSLLTLDPRDIEFIGRCNQLSLMKFAKHTVIGDTYALITEQPSPKHPKRAKALSLYRSCMQILELEFRFHAWVIPTIDLEKHNGLHTVKRSSIG